MYLLDLYDYLALNPFNQMVDEEKESYDKYL